MDICAKFEEKTSLSREWDGREVTVTSIFDYQNLSPARRHKISDKIHSVAKAKIRLFIFITLLF